MKNKIPSGKYLGIGLILLSFAPLSRAATITLQASDSGSVQSYRAAGNWSNAEAPSSLHDYVVGSGRNLYGPGNGGTWVFQGNSLTLTGGSYLIGYAANGQTLQVDNLILNGGQINNFGGALTVAGNISLIGGANAFRLTPGKGDVTVSAAVSGAGGVTIATSATSQDSLAVILSHANTYEGGTTVASNATLTGRSDGAFGLGNVTLNGGNIKMELGATNNYIADGATLFLASTLANGAVNLSYSGIDTIARLSFDGGLTFASAGTWGAFGSGATYQSSVFTGSGQLLVVPEPSAVLMLGLAGAVFLFRQRRSKA